MNAIKDWKQSPVSLALDTTLLWNEYYMIHLSVVCCGRAVPLLWKTLKHKSASVTFEEYRPLLDQAHELLVEFTDVTLLADRAFPCHDLLDWLRPSRWHWCLRLARDTLMAPWAKVAVVPSVTWPRSGVKPSSTMTLDCGKMPITPAILC